VKGLQKYSFGLLPVIAFLWIALIGQSCSKKPERNTSPINIGMPPPPPPAASGTKRLLALGDSYTIGQSVSEAERFPNQTIRILQSKGFDFIYPARIIATTGWTTQNLLTAIANSDVSTQPAWDAITLLIGVNNQFQGRDTNEYRLQFTECLTKAIQLSGNNAKHVFVLSIPDWSVTPFGASYNQAQVAAAIDKFNSINKEITLQMGVSYIDVTPISRQNDRSLIAGDDLHPSGKQYGLWAQLLTPVMEMQLK
jgi:lysophospholipase L1-like esterase